MKSTFIDFLKIKLKKKKIIKLEIKNKILQSIFQNKKISSNKRLFSFFLNLKKSNKIYKHKNICLLTGKTSSVSNTFFLSRNCLKNLLNLNKLQNVKQNSW